MNNLNKSKGASTVLRDESKPQIGPALLAEYFRESSIPGCKYFSERRRHWSERVFWVIIFSMAICLSSWMITNAWAKWDRSPVIMSNSEKPTPVWKIPFPAVTICPAVKTTNDENHSTLTRIYKKRERVTNMTTSSIEQLQAFLQICKDQQCPECHGMGDKFTNDSVLHIMYDMSTKLNSAIYNCKWRNFMMNCSENFRTIATEEGICFTFNSLNPENIYSNEMSLATFEKIDDHSADHWSLEDGYDDRIGGWDRMEAYPNRVWNTGPKAGLEVELNMKKKDFGYRCLGGAKGFKVTLHSPAEIPQPSKHFFYVPQDTDTLVSVKPNMIETSIELKNYSPYQKQCYLNSERKLRFFKIYTQRHCELECLANYILKKCGCVLFFHPRVKGTPICNIGKLLCVRQFENKLARETFINGSNNMDEMTQQGCSCLPACTTITYEMEISQSKSSWEGDFDDYMPPGIDFGFTVGLLRIYFKDNEFITSKRSELYGLTDFLAASGGLLGGLLGVTAISFVEIIYYLTIRLAWTHKMHRSDKSKNPTNE